MRVGNSRSLTTDGVLAGLGPDHVVAADGDARLVVGPVGAVVLAPAPRSGAAVAGAAAHVHRLAVQTRIALCRHVAWVPFVDGLLVTPGRHGEPADVTVVPVDLLHAVLTEGRPVVDEATLAATRAAVHAGRLGRWRPVPHGDDPARTEPATGGGRIDLCQDTDTTPAAGSR